MTSFQKDCLHSATNNQQDHTTSLGLVTGGRLEITDRKWTILTFTRQAEQPKALFRDFGEVHSRKNVWNCGAVLGPEHAGYTTDYNEKMFTRNSSSSKPVIATGDYRTDVIRSASERYNGVQFFNKRTDLFSAIRSRAQVVLTELICHKAFLHNVVLAQNVYSW